MGLAAKLGMKQNLSISWDITPWETFAIFESWGGDTRVRNKLERYYYFYIDNWEPPAKLYLMERGVKHAKILAKIDAPQELLESCVKGQGKAFIDRNYAIDAKVKDWIMEKIIDSDDQSMVHPIKYVVEKEAWGPALPGNQTPLPAGLTTVRLHAEPRFASEIEVPEIIREGNFFDTQYNPEGRFENFLVDNNDQLTVSDLRSNIMWQRQGCDLTNIKTVRKYIEKMNAEKLAGHSDWRLPTLEEAMSLMESKKNAKGNFLNPCFSKEQPFIFVADRRKPGGYWFVDYKQGTAFWASGSIPGGFGRLCRSF